MQTSTLTPETCANELLGRVHHHPADSHFVTTILSRLPLALQGSVSKTYGYQFDTNGRQAANHYLLSVQDYLQGKTLLTLSDENIRLKAARLAANFRSDDLSKAVQYLASQGFDLPAGDTEQSTLARVKCPLWWQRALCRQQDRQQEQLAIQLGLVRQGLQPYCSTALLSRIQARHQRSMKLLEGFEAVSDEGRCAQSGRSPEAFCGESGGTAGGTDGASAWF